MRAQVSDGGSDGGASRVSRRRWGGGLFALVGAGLVVYALVFIAWVFVGATVELGIDEEAIGTSRDALAATRPELVGYLDHLHLAVGGFMLGLGIAVAGLGWFAIRRGESWALWVTLGALVAAFVVATPLHYVHGFTSLLHLGPLYLGSALVVAATWLSWTRSASPPVGGSGKG